MYFRDSYIMYDTETKRKYVRYYKDVCVGDMMYTRQGLLKAVNKWNRDSIVFHNGRYIYHAKEL